MLSIFADSIPIARLRCVFPRPGFPKNNIATDIGCHLDPDLDYSIFNQMQHWRALFGQMGAAQGHLKNQSVPKGDLFLFFGWFREVVYDNGKYQYSRNDKNGRHIIYGYMQVADVKKINSNQFDKWMSYHPHISKGENAVDSDHIYIANDVLTFNTTLPGYGTFNFNNNLVLTKKGYSKSRWDLPVFFRNSSISYHSTNS